MRYFHTHFSAEGIFTYLYFCVSALRLAWRRAIIRWVGKRGYETSKHSFYIIKVK